MNKNKNFRKSSIVIPALALMVLTAGAGTTGAVAWFTATRSVSANTATFTAVNPSGNLKIKAQSGIGTIVSSDTAISPATNTVNSSSVTNELTDASYDILNHKLYSDYVSEDGAPTTFADVSSNLTRSTISSENTTAYKAAGQITGGSYYFYAFTWSYTISLTNDNSGKSSYVFFDPTASSIPDTTNIAEGFRIAIDTTEAGATLYGGGVSGQNDGHAMIFSKASVTEGENYITDKIGTTGSYASVTKYYSSDGTEKYSDGMDSSTATAKANYLGTISASTSITVFITAWFEGQDSHVVNDNASQAASAKLAFYARSAL